MRRWPQGWVVGALAALVAACSTGPQPIVAGDPCTRCHMPVADERWGAELVTRTGVVRKYDSIECLAHDVLDGAVARADVRSLWVVPFDAPGTLVPVEQAVFVRSDALRSPMGMGLTAFASPADLARSTTVPDAILDWAAVLSVVRSESPTAAAHEHADVALR